MAAARMQRFPARWRAPAVASPAMSADDLAADLLTTVLDADPLTASLFGFPGYDDLLPDFSAEAEQDQARRLTSVAERAEQMPDQGLDETELQTLDFVRYMARGMADAAAVPADRVHHLRHLRRAGRRRADLAAETSARHRRAARRLSGPPARPARPADDRRRAAPGGHRRRPHRRGPARASQRSPSSTWWSPIRPWAPSPGPTSTTQTFAGEISTAIEQSVRPRSAAYRDALQSDVLPAARDDDHPGICFLPGGESMYRVLARLHTSMDFSHDELHAAGREIVDEVRQELAETGSRLWGTTDIAKIFDRMSNDPSLRYESREEMLGHARRVVAAAEAEAPRWFAVVPDEPCTVEPVPEAEEAGMAAAYYMPGAIDGSRQGTYFLNTSKPRGASPLRRRGHRVPRSGARTSLPAHHRDGVQGPSPGATGAARHRLRGGMGPLQRAPRRRDGALQRRPGPDGALRRRLVASEPVGRRHGLHAMGWTRQQALDWMAEHTPLPRIEIESEVDRYISYPGQALAYMVGRREIVRLRTAAADALGARFDLRDFHDLVLRAGILPLPALARTVERWMERVGS